MDERIVEGGGKRKIKKPVKKPVKKPTKPAKKR
jgi:hypothetical protein